MDFSQTWTETRQDGLAGSPNVDLGGSIQTLDGLFQQVDAAIQNNEFEPLPGLEQDLNAAIASLQDDVTQHLESNLDSPPNPALLRLVDVAHDLSHQLHHIIFIHEDFLLNLDSEQIDSEFDELEKLALSDEPLE